MNPLFGALRPAFICAGVFSLVMNLLLLAPSLFMLQVFDRVLTSRHGETLAMLIAGTLVALALMAVLDVLRGRLLAGGAVLLERAVSPRVIEVIVNNVAQPRAGANAHGLRDIATLRGALTGPAMFSVFDAPWLPFYLILIALFHPLLGAIALAGTAALAVLALANERATRRPLAAMLGENRRAGAFMDASLRNAETIQGMGMLSAVTARWMKINDASLTALSNTATAGGAISAISRLTRQGVQVAMLGAGAWLVLDQNVTSGVMIAATLILGRALAPVEALVGNWRALAEGYAAYRRVSKLIDEAGTQQAPTPLPVPKGALSVDNVSFRFPQRDLPSLHRIQFQLAPGESLGIVGPSASGKSTLARLLIGIWSPLAGTVRLDGADLAQRPRAEIGPHIGYLPQDVALFSGTVADNIARLGDSDKDRDAEAVVRAAQRANCHELILKLPDGYDTDIGENGVLLSAGQRQRIALARALYNDPVLVVLDEPNSNLDADGEQALSETLRTLKGAGVTVVTIAHRPLVLATMDKIVVLKDGAIEHAGPREETMKRLTRTVAQVQA